LRPAASSLERMTERWVSGDGPGVIAITQRELLLDRSR
jgi:hypothetical protein